VLRVPEFPLVYGQVRGQLVTVAVDKMVIVDRGRGAQVECVRVIVLIGFIKGICELVLAILPPEFGTTVPKTVVDCPPVPVPVLPVEEVVP
jgi:hypothetical protein